MLPIIFPSDIDFLKVDFFTLRLIIDYSKFVHCFPSSGYLTLNL